MGTITKGLIAIMLDGGMYSEMITDPITYHGYKETIQNLEDVIEEIDVEIMLRPQSINNLLDHRSSLQKRLDKLNNTKNLNMPSISD